MLYGQPLCPRAICTTNAIRMTAISASAVIAVARRSMALIRSSLWSSRPFTVSLRRRARSRAPLNATMMASASTPHTGSPAIERATRYTTPIAAPKIGVARYLRLVLGVVGLVVVGMEDLLDACAEKPGDRDGQGKRGGVPVGLDRVDRLPGHVEPLGEVGLRKPLRDTALAHVIAHRARPRCQARLSFLHHAGPGSWCQARLSSPRWAAAPAAHWWPALTRIGCGADCRGRRPAAG